MESIFQKTNFPKSPGGNIYNWEKAYTNFDIDEEGKYIIAITASCKNGKQNDTGDDDDLRVIIDNYEFGKYEAHKAKISWRGFGTAGAWDGASLKGGTKTVYFFMELYKGKHIIQFQADGSPKLTGIQIFKIDEKKEAIEDVIFDFNEQSPGIKIDNKGIPWKAFIFKNDFNSQNFFIKLLDIKAKCKSAKQKGGTDGDNIKVYLNGSVFHNPISPTSNKYKNFFFSGDLSQGKTEYLMIDGKNFLLSDKDFSIELWYDGSPVLEQVKFELVGNSKYDLADRFDSWMARIIEGSRLPVSLWDNMTKVREITINSLDLANQYAEKNGFKPEDREDNEIDALRHFTWNLLLSREYGEENTKIITTNHELFWNEINNKSDLSRSNIMDLWNNKQGRDYALEYPDKDFLELFKIAKSKGDVILSLDAVTDIHIEKITYDIKNK